MIMGEQNCCESGSIVFGTGVGMAFGFIRLLCITTHNACQWPMGASEDCGLEQAGTLGARPLGARHETVTVLFFLSRLSLTSNLFFSS